MEHRRTALITGGAKRVGRAIVERLAGAGFDVIFTYRNSESDAHALTASLATTKVSVRCLRADFSHDSGALEIADQLKKSLDRLDVLVNSASMYLPDAANEDLSELMRRHDRVNHQQPVLLTQSLAPLLRRARGHVVNMLDILAERPMPSFSAYCSSKAAMLNSTITLARQLAPEVTVNGISPGVVDWPDAMPLEEREAYLSRVPLRRAGTPLDVANLVHFLVTAGTYITGQVIRLDGGRSINWL